MLKKWQKENISSFLYSKFRGKKTAFRSVFSLSKGDVKVKKCNFRFSLPNDSKPHQDLEQKSDE